MASTDATVGTRRRCWYGDGLRFECQPDCGACCVNHGDYSFVYLEDGEVDALAEFLEIGRSEFLRRFTAVDDGHIVLRMDAPACPFLVDDRCSVYPVRPVQCSTFPFWKENLRTRANWSKLKEFCPGIGKGERVDLDTIRRELAAREE